MSATDSTPSDQFGCPHDPTAPVVLCGFSQPPLVRGKVLERLNEARYAVVEALVEAGVDGLTKDKLDEKSGRYEAGKILKRLRDSSPEWAVVIHMAGKKGLHYRIA